MSYVPTSKLAETTLRLIPDRDPPYTQLTSDQLREISEIKSSIQESIIIETQDADYKFNETANWNQSQTSVKIKPKKTASWVIEDPYITSFFHQYGTTGAGNVVSGHKSDFPDDMLISVQMVFLDTSNSAISQPQSYNYLSPLSTPSNQVETKKYLSNYVSYSQGGPQNNSYEIDGESIRALVYWNRDIIVIYSGFKNGQKVIDKRYTASVKLHGQITLINNKAIQNISLHATPMAEENFITDEQRLYKAVISDD